MIRGRPLGVLAAIAVVVVAAVCVRLGFWQLSKLEAKRLVNRERREALALPPVVWSTGVDPTVLHGRRVVAHGRYDETRHILLRGRIHQGEPGVVVVTALRPDSGAAILVERGWLPAGDGLTARPQDYPEPGPVEVVGILRAIAAGVKTPAPRLLSGDEPQIFTAAALDLDSLARAIPYPVATVVLRQLAGPGVPARPVRTEEMPENESMHLGYAVQWFAFAVILVAGSTLFAWTRRRRGSTRNLPPQG